MDRASHQTVRLERGKHASPEDGACVLELASMLAGEPFDDHPQCVCPVIGTFLRTYNDVIDDDRRQDLYDYASRIVGSRSSTLVEQLRAERLRSWARENAGGRWSRFLALSPLAALLQLQSSPERVAILAARVTRRRRQESHLATLALLDELLLVGRHQPALDPNRTEHPITQEVRT